MSEKQNKLGKAALRLEKAREALSIAGKEFRRARLEFDAALAEASSEELEEAGKEVSMPISSASDPASPSL